MAPRKNAGVVPVATRRSSRIARKRAAAAVAADVGSTGLDTRESQTATKAVAKNTTTKNASKKAATKPAGVRKTTAIEPIAENITPGLALQKFLVEHSSNVTTPESTAADKAVVEEASGKTLPNKLAGTQSVRGKAINKLTNKRNAARAEPATPAAAKAAAKPTRVTNSAVRAVLEEAAATKDTAARLSPDKTATPEIRPKMAATVVVTVRPAVESRPREENSVNPRTSSTGERTRSAPRGSSTSSAVAQARAPANVSSAADEDFITLPSSYSQSPGKSLTPITATKFKFTKSTAGSPSPAVKVQKTHEPITSSLGSRSAQRFDPVEPQEHDYTFLLDSSSGEEETVTTPSQSSIRLSNGLPPAQTFRPSDEGLRVESGNVTRAAPLAPYRPDGTIEGDPMDETWENEIARVRDRRRRQRARTSEGAESPDESDVLDSGLSSTGLHGEVSDTDSAPDSESGLDSGEGDDRYEDEDEGEDEDEDEDENEEEGEDEDEDEDEVEDEEEDEDEDNCTEEDQSESETDPEEDPGTDADSGSDGGESSTDGDSDSASDASGSDSEDDEDHDPMDSAWEDEDTDYRGSRRTSRWGRIFYDVPE